MFGKKRADPDRKSADRDGQSHLIYITKEKIDELLARAPEHLKPVTPRRMVAFDVETPNTVGNCICSAGLTVIENNRVTDTVEIRVNPESFFDWRCVRVHGITADEVADEPTFPEVWDTIRGIMEDSVILAHNATFDLGVLKKMLYRYGLDFHPVTYADTLTISRAVYGKSMPNHKLGTLCAELGIPLDAHKAGSDSFGCAELYLRMQEQAGELREFDRFYDFS